MGRYCRTVSFPNPSPSFRAPATAKSFHVRSASLPCGRSHPLIPQLRDKINEFKAWDRSRPVDKRVVSGWVCDGLTGLRRILDSLDDVLQLPQTQDALSTSITLVEKLLEDFLRFVDAFGIFQAAMLALKEEISASHVAVRRKDDAKLGVHVKAQRKIAGEIDKLVSAVRSIDVQQISCAAAALDNNNNYHDDDLGHVIREVHGLTMLVSGLVFNGVSSSFGSGRKWVGFGLSRKGKSCNKEIEGIEEFQRAMGGLESLWELRKNNNKKDVEEMIRTTTLKGMKELEECMIEMERGSESVFRSLIATRVSLLNILTHA